MALFNRNKKDPVLPEVEKYYEAEKRDRAGAGWLLALVSVLTVALVIVGLFLAGRWAYNKVTDDGEVATTENGNTDTPSFDGEGEQGGDTDESEDENADDENNNSDDEQAANDDEEVDGNVDAPARTDTPNDTEGGKADEDLPNTGPADTLAIFAVSTVAGTAVQYAIQRRKIER